MPSPSPSPSSSPGPAVLKKRLGARLRALRIAAGVTVSQTAEALGCGEGKVRHMENGRNAPSKPDLTVMIGLYGDSSNEHEALEELRKAANSRGWWSAYRLPSWLHNYVGMEADSTRIRNLEVEVIPGLLQTEAYAREVQAFGPVVLEPEVIDRMVAARLKRQELLTKDHPVTYHAIMSEAALHRLKATEYAETQYRHLLDMAARPNVTIKILPFSEGVHYCMASGFVVLDFPHDIASPVAYCDHIVGGQLIHDLRQVARLSNVYDEIAALAMSPEETVAFIATWL